MTSASATQIAFHFNVTDKQAYLCRLLRKIVNSGMKAWVVLEPEALKALDQNLWTFSQEDFIAHACQGDDPLVAARSSVVLATTVPPEANAQVLVNASAEIPGGFERFARVVEVVSQDPQDREAARDRWRHYTTLGYSMQRHDIQSSPSS